MSEKSKVIDKKMTAEELLKELAACQSDDLTGSIGFVAFDNAGDLYLSMTRRVKGEFKHVPLKVSVGGLLEDPEKLRKALRETAEVLGVSRNAAVLSPGGAGESE